MGGQNTVICMKLFPRPPSSLNLIFLCLLTAVECGKGLLGRKVMIFVFLHLCFLSPISPQNSSARFLAFSSQKSGRNFSYEPKAKLVPVTGLIWRLPQKNIRTKYMKRCHHYQCQIKGWPNKTINYIIKLTGNGYLPYPPCSCTLHPDMSLEHLQSRSV